MPAKQNLIGERFGLLVVHAAAPAANKKTFWNCVCDCGNFICTRADALRDGMTLSCGCFGTAKRRMKRGALETTGSILKFESCYIPEPNSGCWLWLSNVNPQNGYGRFYGPGGKPVYAHTFSFLTFKGAIPKGKMLRHTCDVKICVNPDHLITGTAKDNARDAVERGLHAHGVRHGMAKLTAEQVQQIRASEASATQLSRTFSTSRMNIDRIRKRLIWKSVP
jgi:hypothetical protein